MHAIKSLGRSMVRVLTFHAKGPGFDSRRSIFSFLLLFFPPPFFSPPFLSPLLFLLLFMLAPPLQCSNIILVIILSYRVSQHLQCTRQTSHLTAWTNLIHADISTCNLIGPYSHVTSLTSAFQVMKIRALVPTLAECSQTKNW